MWRWRAPSDGRASHEIRPLRIIYFDEARRPASHKDFASVISERPVVILLTRNFPPLQGGMEKLNFHIYDTLRDSYEVHVVGPRGAEQYCHDLNFVHTSPSRPVWRFLIGSFWQTFHLCRSLRPKLIIAGSGVSALPAVIAGKLTHTPVVTYLHGLDIVAPHLIYQWCFLPAIRRSTACLVNSRNTRQLAINAGIDSSRIEVLHPGTDLHTAPDSEEIRRFRERIDAGERPILLSVGRLTPRKGMLEFIDNSFPDLVRAQADALLVIIGHEAIDSVAGATGNILQRLKSRVTELGLTDHVRFLGQVDERTLHIAYSASQVHVFPVIKVPGDVEGFGMVALEAAAHGLPTVAFREGGIPDSVVDGESGRLVPPGSYNEFAAAIVNVLGGSTMYAECRNFAAQCDWTMFASQLRSHVRNALLS